MKDGQPESLAEALLLIEKMKGKLSEKDQKIENPCPSVTDEDLAAESEEQAEDTSKKKKKSKTEFSFRDSKLPEREVIQDLSEEQRKCPNCGTTMVKVREEITYRLVHIPVREYIEKVVRYIYECPLCVKDDDKPVTKSAKDKRVIEKSLATPELLAFVFVQKHMMHTPYYCLEDAYNWQGIHLSRQNFCNWQQKIYKQTEKLRLLFERELKNGKYLQFDETPIEIQKKNDEEIRAEYWDENNPEHKIKLSNCNVHSRRKFTDSLKATKSPTAKEAIDLYEPIFKKDSELRELFDEKKISEEEFLERRQKEVKPLFDSLHKWLLEKKALDIRESSKTKEAINYCLNRWDNLTRFLNYELFIPHRQYQQRGADRSTVYAAQKELHVLRQWRRCQKQLLDSYHD